MNRKPVSMAMLSIHSSPIGDLGTRDTGGMSICVREIARELGRCGHRIDIFTRPPAGRTQPRIVDLCRNVRVIHLPVAGTGRLPKAALYHKIPQFFSALKKFRSEAEIRYDAVYSHYWVSACLGARASALWQVPHLITFHTLGALKNSCGLGPRDPALRVVSEKRLAQQCDRIIVSSEREKQNLSACCRVPPEKIDVVCCGVDLKCFRPISRRQARRRLGIGPGPLVLCVARPDPLKGIDRLLEAFSLRRGPRPPRLLIVGGDGDRDPALEELIGRLGIRQRVALAGRVEHSRLYLYYSAADVLAVPSRYESFGLVALEALACGIPVIAAPVGAMERLIRPGETGRVLPDPSREAFAEALEAFFASPQKVRPEEVRASVSGFSWARTAEDALESLGLAAATGRERFESRRPVESVFQRRAGDL